MGHEQSFADVLNSLGNGPKRPREAGSHREGPDELPVEQMSISWLATSRPAVEQGGPEPQWPARSEQCGGSEDFAAAVRPYAWTRSRPRPRYDLAVETLVSTGADGRDVAALTSAKHRAVAELCCAPRAVAEVAALLFLPLGVARVLLGDMAEIGLVVVHRTATSSGGAPGFGFMERVLSGLQRL